MRSANLKLSHPQIDASDLAAQIRSATERGAAGDNAAIHTETSPADQTTDYRPATLILDRSFEVNRNDRYDIGQLVRFSDAEFVDAAYRAILKREPDAAGARFYLRGLRQEQLEKLDVILTLLASEEGRQKNVRIEGLTAPLWLHRMTRLPGVGSWLKYAIDFVRAPILIRRLEQLLAFADARNQQIANHVNLINREFAAALNDRLSTVNASIVDVANTIEERHGEVREQISGLRRGLNDSIGEAETKLRDETNSAIALQVDATRAEFQQELASFNTAVAENVRGTESKIDELRGEMESAVGKIHDVHSETVRRTERLTSNTQRLRQEIVIQRARLALLEELVKGEPAEFDKKLKTVDEPVGNLESLYAELEDNFRGNRDTLKQSLRFYLPYLQSLPNPELSVIDLGCGRGEWLEVLSDNGVKALGVDNSRVMIQSCREGLLRVVESAALSYLRGQQENSLRAVTAFHLIEHLSFADLIALLDQIMRTLQPGGAAIFETPNPDNLFVASNYFYHDPTHRHPLPSRLTKFLVESRGFARVEIINLHECAEGRFTGSDEVSVRLNQLFYGPMDYAIVGWKHDQ